MCVEDFFRTERGCVEDQPQQCYQIKRSNNSERVCSSGGDLSSAATRRHFRCDKFRGLKPHVYRRAVAAQLRTVRIFASLNAKRSRQGAKNCLKDLLNAHRFHQRDQFFVGAFYRPSVVAVVIEIAAVDRRIFDHRERIAVGDIGGI